MKKHIYDYISDKNNKKFIDVDFHDFIEMKERGLSSQEMSNELGIPKSYVNKLVDDLRKNY